MQQRQVTGRRSQVSAGNNPDAEKLPEPPIIWLVNDGVGRLVVAQNTEPEL